MAENWDTRTADNCKLPDLIPEICENCRDIQYCEAKERGKQMTFDELESDEVFGYVYRNKGRKRTPLNEHEKTWMWDERCGTCQAWTVLIPQDQPPDGWGIRGFCNTLTAVNHKEWNTNQMSYCEYYRAICKKCGKYARSREECIEEVNDAGVL